MLTFTPPSPVTGTDGGAVTVSLGPDNPVSTATLGPIDGRGYCSNTAGAPLSVGGPQNQTDICIMSGAYIKDVTSGNWTLAKNGAAVASFDLGVTLPFVDGDITKMVLGPTPLVRVTKDDSGTVTEIDVEWKYYDAATDAYLDAAGDDARAMVQRLIGGQFMIGLMNFGTAKEEYVYTGNVATTGLPHVFTDFANDWKVTADQSGGDYELTTLQVEYMVGGVSLGFWLGR